MGRSRTLALARKSEAVRHFRNGCTFDQIAKKVGFANRGTAHRVVTQAYTERIADDIDAHRALEVCRLDAVQAEMWDVMDKSTAAGERIAAANVILKVIDQRSKLLGLYDHPPAPPQMLINRPNGNA